MSIQRLKGHGRNGSLTSVAKVATLVASLCLVIATGRSGLEAAAIATIVLGAIVIVFAGGLRN